MESAEVVIIGGGVMGCSIAFHLAAAGVSDVLLLEARELAAGSSGKPLGGVRAQFSSSANVLLGARSLAAYRRFGAEVGGDIGLEQVGYAFLLRTAAEVAGFEAAVALQNELGVPSRMLEPGEARRLNPYLGPDDDLLAAAYSPDDGYTHPGSVVRGYAAAAQARGVRIRTGTAVVGIERDGDRLTGVRTASDVVRTGTVICAAGAWSKAIGAMAGVELPVEPLRRQIAFTPPLNPAPPRIPFTIDYASTAYFHPAPGGSLLVGLAEADQPVGFGTGYDEGWHPALRAALARCAPGLAGVPLERGWAGLYEMTPDCDALIGEAAGVERFLYACGYSGHGLVQAPATGELIRDLYLGIRPFCDPAAFDATRFTAGAARTELTII